MRVLLPPFICSSPPRHHDVEDMLRRRSGDGLARGVLTSRTPSNACGDVSARQSMVSRCVETPARHLRLTTLLVPILSTTDRTCHGASQSPATRRCAWHHIATQRLCRRGSPAAPRVADARGDPVNCNKRVGTRDIDPDCMRKRGGPHVMELAGLGRVDVLGAPVRRRDDGERE